MSASEQRTLGAVCEAMAPALDGLPAAELEVDVSGPIGRLVRSLSPRVALRIRLALRVFEWLPFPWRFSRLEPAAREEFLRRMERSRFSLHHELLLLAKTLGTLGYAVDSRVESRIGIVTGCALADGEAPPPRRPLGDLSPDGEAEECDVVVIGSGAGGAAAATVLAEAGLDVIVLEAGGSFDRDSYPEDRLEAIAALYRDGGLTIAEGRPPIPVPVARTVGGTTVINSGTCFRAPEQLLDGWRDRFGVDWATELDPEFSEAEDFLRVTPVDPARMGRNGQLAMEGAAAIGASGGPIPRNAGDCVQCSSCPYGCAIDAKQGMHVSYLPRAVAAGARIRAGVEARRVLVEEGRAAGVRCEVGGAGGDRALPYTVRARRATVVAGGAFGTPELLIRSGLGNAQVGRNLHIHPACWVGARYEEEVRGWEGVMQSYYIDQWEKEGMLLEATFTPLPFGGAWLLGSGLEHQESILRFGQVASIGAQLMDETAGRVGIARDGSIRATYRLGRADADRVAFGIARAAEVHFAAGATEVYPNIARVPVLRPGELADFEATTFSPSELRLEAFHPMGTARISADPREGVCDPSGAVHGAADLFVADASLFPSAVGVNPMMTIIAFAQRIAAGLLAGEGRRSPAPSPPSREFAGTGERRPIAEPTRRLEEL